MAQRFKPGQHLVERDLCEQTGVSRSSVREALRHLEAEGLVERRGNRGLFVASITPDEARQIYEVRAAIEPEMARLFAARATEDDLAALSAIARGARAREPLARHRRLRARARRVLRHADRRHAQRGRGADRAQLAGAHQLSQGHHDRPGRGGAAARDDQADARHRRLRAPARRRGDPPAVPQLHRAVGGVRHRGAERESRISRREPARRARVLPFSRARTRGSTSVESRSRQRIVCACARPGQPHLNIRWSIFGLLGELDDLVVDLVRRAEEQRARADEVVGQLLASAPRPSRARASRPDRDRCAARASWRS